MLNSFITPRSVFVLFCSPYLKTSLIDGVILMNVVVVVLMMYNDMCQNMEDLHNSVNHYF